PARISGVVPDTPAEAAGLQAGDTVISVDGRAIDRFETLQQMIRINAGSEVDLVINRNGEEILLPLTPAVRIIDDGFGGKGQIGVMGVYGPTAPARIGEIEPGSRAEAAGLEPGDLIVEADGALVQNARELINQLEDKAEQPVTFTVLRGVDPDIIGPNEAPADALTLSVELTPTAFPLPAEPAASDPNGDSTDESAAENSDQTTDAPTDVVGSLPGISWTPLPDTTRVYRNPFHAVYRATAASYEMGANTLTALWQLVSGQRSVKELGGPLKIARISGDVAQQNVMALLHFMVLLSINLGLINLLPVPVLDGGHLVFYGIEALRGKPVGLKAQEYCFRVGLALSLCLMIFATWNDIMQMFVNNA
ncbi:MAG: site-2 protease family protein, partial [Pseudomonadota bacterium]